MPNFRTVADGHVNIDNSAGMNVIRRHCSWTIKTVLEFHLLETAGTRPKR